MNSNKELYEIEFTEDCIKEIDDIHEYISGKLMASLSAKRLMKKLKERLCY